MLLSLAAVKESKQVSRTPPVRSARVRNSSTDDASYSQTRSHDRAASHGVGWSFDRFPVFSPENAERRRAPLSGKIQAKLAVGAVNDPLEDEADRAAGQVLRSPGNDAAPARSLAEADGQIRSADSGESRDGLPASGRPLDPATRAFFEPRFGYDFGRVRVHADANAAESAESLGALAYTAGPNIAFGAGQYRPGTGSGQRLLAHELAHVVQQGHADGPGGRVAVAAGQATPAIQRQTPQGQGAAAGPTA
jgi:hypothetical protein